MGTPFLGEVRIFSFNYAPKGWGMCNGQILPIAQNQALFALLGTMYGGNGSTTFALPSLQGRTPIHLNNGFVQGQLGGEENHTLLITEIPAHNHVLSVSSAAANNVVPTTNTLGVSTANLYATPGAVTTMLPGTIALAGSSQPHSNLQPYLALNFCIALTGIFPSRN